MKKNSFIYKKIEERKFYVLLGFVFLVFLIGRIFSNQYYLKDSYQYLDVAHKMSKGVFFEDGFWIFSRRLFIYPFFLLICLSNVYLVLFCQSLMLLFSFYNVNKILRFYNIPYTFLTLTLFALCSSVFIYTHVLMAEVLVLAVLSLFFRLLIVNFNENKIKYLQMLILILALTKPVFYPFVYLNLVFFGYYCLKNKTHSIWLWIPIIIIELIINLNAQKFGIRQYATIENVNLISYNLYNYKSKTLGEEKAAIWFDSVKISVENLPEKEHQMKLRNIAKNEIKENLLGYTSYHVTTGFRGIFDPGRFDFMTFLEKENGKQGFLEILNNRKSFFDLFKNSKAWIYVLLIPVFIAILFKLFFLIKFFFEEKWSFTIFYLLIFIIFYICLTGPVNCSRYMMPFQLLFTVLGLNNFYKKINKKDISQKSQV